MLIKVDGTGVKQEIGDGSFAETLRALESKAQSESVLTPVNSRVLIVKKTAAVDCGKST